MPAVGSLGPPYPIANSQSPSGFAAMDPATGAVGLANVWGYTAVSTTGTTTLKTTPGVFGGLVNVALGTAWVGVVYDIATATNIIMGTQTFTAVGQILGSVTSGAIRTTGAIVVVMTGTAGSALALWD